MITNENFNKITQVLNRTQIDVLDCLINTYPNAKSIFMADDSLPIPPFELGQIDYSVIKQNINDLSSIIMDISDMSDWQRSLFTDSINLSLEKNNYVLANLEYNAASESEKSVIAKRFIELQEILFGAPDKSTYLSILGYMLTNITERQLNDEDNSIYEELLQLLPEIPNKTNKLFYPSQELQDKLHDRVKSFYEPFLRHIPDKEIFELNEAYHIANEILNEEFSKIKSNWRIMYDEDYSTAYVDQIKREIHFPGKRNEPHYTKDSITELIIHEVGVHFLRELPFDNIEIEPLRIGLRGYVTVEEGIATVLSQAAVNKFKYSGLRHYVTIGLAYFYNLSFREVYEIQKRLQYLFDGASFGTSYDSVNRAFRGTYQLVNCKDLAYFIGNQKIWHFIEENIDSPSLFDDLLLSGKIDIFNEEQQKIIKAIKETYIIIPAM